MAFVLYILIAFVLSINKAAQFQSSELIYDSETSGLANGVKKFISISGCFFECVDADCIVLEGEGENFCLIIATLLESKQGNLREGHFNEKVSKSTEHQLVHIYFM